MGDKKARNKGGDSLAEVTLERDQLLKNEKTYQQRILQLEEEVKAVVEQSQQLSAENQQLLGRLEGGGTKGSKGGGPDLEALKKENQELAAMVAKTTGEKQQLEFENESMQSRLTTLEGQEKQVDALEKENRHLKNNQADLEKRIQALEKEKQALEEKPQGKGGKQTDKMAAIQSENKKLQMELANLQTKNSATEKKMEKLQAENNELYDRMEQKRSELDELMRAMKTETTEEVKMKRVQKELEGAQHKVDDYKRQLEEAKRKCQQLEKDRDSAQSALRLRESELKGSKANTDEKDTQIEELKRQVGASKRNAKQLQADLDDVRHLEKDTANMKARIRSLKTEIEDSLAANQKMKAERTESRLQIERLTRELAASTEALTESKRLVKKLESDKGSKNRLQDEVRIRRQREIELERQVYDMNARLELAQKKIQIVEEEKQRLEMNSDSLAEMETHNKTLQDENKTLRNLIAERNREISRHQVERNSLLKRMDNLERHQMDSDIKVQQLKGWVDNVHINSDYSASSHNTFQQQPLVTLPPVPPHSITHQSRGGGPVSNYTRRRPQQHLHRQERQQQLNRSWENMHRPSAEQNGNFRGTPGSLPVVLDSRQDQAVPGYFDMYRNKMNLIRERRW